nr:unnamed protein product [Spirometra erinaceieuropaei]
MLGQLQTDIDVLHNELAATKRQLASKCEAIKILSKRLDESTTETNQFKLMTEERYKSLKKSLNPDPSCEALNDAEKNHFLNLKVRLHESEMANRMLESEITTLRRRTNELSADLEIMRKRSLEHQSNMQPNKELSARSGDLHDRELLISQLEEALLECSRVRKDLQLCQDEKADILSELQSYKDLLSSVKSEDQISAPEILKLIRDNESMALKISHLEAENARLSELVATNQVLGDSVNPSQEDSSMRPARSNGPSECADSNFDTDSTVAASTTSEVFVTCDEDGAMDCPMHRNNGESSPPCPQLLLPLRVKMWSPLHQPAPPPPDD